MPREITELVTADVPVLRADALIRDAAAQLLDSGLPALPVVDEQDRYKGVFGEREFMRALFPRYVGNLQGAGFVTRTLEDALEKRDACSTERVGDHLHEEHVEVGEDFSDMQVAEVFLHHRVLIVPVVSGRRVVGVITRADFFRALARKLLGR